MAVSDGPSPELAELFDRLLSQAEECDRFAAEHPEPEVRQLFKDQAADIRGQVRREFEREAILQSLRDGDLGPWEKWWNRLDPESKAKIRRRLEAS